MQEQTIAQERSHKESKQNNLEIRMPIHTLFARWRAMTLIRSMVWLAFYIIRQRRKRRLRTRARLRKFWSRDVLAGRREQGDHHNLGRELQLSDREFYFKRVLY